jgi:hypothetical protein
MSAMKTTDSHLHNGLTNFLPIIPRHLNFGIEFTQVCIEFSSSSLEGLMWDVHRVFTDFAGATSPIKRTGSRRVASPLSPEHAVLGRMR